MRSPRGRGPARRRRPCRRPSPARPTRSLTVAGPPLPLLQRAQRSGSRRVIRDPQRREQGRTMTTIRTALPLAAVVLAVLPAAASANNAPYDVAKPAVERTRLHAGERIALGATVQPLGTRPQRHLTVFFLASRDGRYDRGDGVIAKRRISVLGERPRRVRARPALRPRAGGRWHVVVCIEQRGRHGRRCADTPRTVNVSAARAGKPKPPPSPGPAPAQAPRFLGVTDVGIDD